MSNADESSRTCVRRIGNEFVLACDMRFASRQSALFGNPEVGVGPVPGGGALEWLPRLVGRSRAAKIVLSGDDCDAEIAERHLLDFYVWLVWKCWSARQRGAPVPLFSVGGLVNQLGTDEYSSERFFQRKANFCLRQVKALWPKCPAQVSRDGKYLRIAPSIGPSPVRPTSAALSALPPTGFS